MAGALRSYSLNQLDCKYVFAGKVKCKEALQKELGLTVNKDIPLLGFIGRLDYQKGPDLVLDAIPELANRNCQLIMLGSGKKEYEERMQDADNHHKHFFRYY